MSFSVPFQFNTLQRFHPFLGTFETFPVHFLPLRVSFSNSPGEFKATLREYGVGPFYSYKSKYTFEVQHQQEIVSLKS